MKKIAVICTLYGPNGGTGRVTTELFERFARDGWEVHVFCTEQDSQWAQNSAVAEIVELPVTRIGLLRQLHFLIKASIAVKKSEYDLVYATGDYYYDPDFVTIHILKKHGRKVIERLEKSGVLEKNTNVIKRMARKIYCPLLFEIGEQFVYRRKNCCYIGVSDGVALEFCQEFGQKFGENVVSISNGVDAVQNQFRADARATYREQLNIPSNKKTLLFVGSDWNRKRLDVAIEVCGRLPDFHLIVAGHDNPCRYTTLAEKWACADRIHFIGFTKNIENYYSVADYFLFPSAYETFGLVALEAMAAGMVVISNRLNGVCDFIEHEKNGFLTSSENADGFIEVFQSLIAHPECEETIRQNAVLKASELNWDTCYEQYRQIFISYERGKQ